MRRDAVAIIAMVVILSTLEVGAIRSPTPVASRVNPFPIEREGSPPDPDTMPVAWHPILPWVNDPLSVLVDPRRDRIVVSAGPPISRMIVVDHNGTILTNVSSAEIGAPFGIEASTGYIYASGRRSGGSRVVVVDPLSGSVVLGPWTYDVGEAGGGSVLGNGKFYLLSMRCPPPPGGTCCFEPAIIAANATNGQVVANHSLPAGCPHLTTTDPSGDWLLGTQSPVGAVFEVTFRVHTTDFTFDAIGPYGDGIGFSPDGGTVYVCGYPDTTGWPNPSKSLRAYWVANGSLRSTGYCRMGPIAVNPVTGVIALSDAYLSDGGPIIARMFVNNTCAKSGWAFDPFPLTSLAWTANGRALIGVAKAGPDDLHADCHMALGAWEGRPYLVPPFRLVNPESGVFSVQAASTSGLNGTTLGVWVDEGPWPLPTRADVIGSITVNVSRLPDGTHRLRVAGWDLLGQPVDGTVEFALDRSAPRITVVSSLLTDASPYELGGTVDDVTSVSVKVNGASAARNGTAWSAQMELLIGNNSFRVDAEDAVKLRSNLTGVVRYWPLHDGVVLNATYHVSVAAPPGWLVSVGSLAGASLNLVLVEPTKDGIGSYFSVQSLASASANGTYDYVRDFARYQADLLHDFGNIIIEYVHADTVDGRTAASFEVSGSSLGYPARSVVTIVASEEWHTVYMLTMNIPLARASANPETRAWILEGFHIGSPPAAPIPGPSYTDWWPSLGLAPVATVAAVALAWLLSFQGRRNRPHRPRHD